jgi:hypothetical protein
MLAQLARWHLLAMAFVRFLTQSAARSVGYWAVL